MSELQTINNSYSIPAPKFNFGDTLQHTFTFSTGRFLFVGEVISRNYQEESTPGAGYWEYEVKGDARLSDCGQFAWSEHIPEDELTVYIPVSVALPQAA